MARTQRLDTLSSLAARGVKLRAGGVSAHIIVCECDDGASEMLVGHLDAPTCDRLAEFAWHLRATRVRITFAARLRAPDGLTLDVVVATDLATGRQAVARLSDGARVRCGRVRHEGVETLMAALQEAREKEGGASARGTARTATLPKGRGRSSRPEV